MLNLSYITISSFQDIKLPNAKTSLVVHKKQFIL